MGGVNGRAVGQFGVARAPIPCKLLWRGNESSGGGSWGKGQRIRGGLFGGLIGLGLAQPAMGDKGALYCADALDEVLVVSLAIVLFD